MINLQQHNPIKSNHHNSRNGVIILRGRYQLLEPLAKGSYGSVYKAYDNERQECVVIKKISKLTLNEINGFGIAQVNIREYSILKSLNHKNIIKLKDIFYSDKQMSHNKDYTSLYMVFDLMDQTLSRFQKQHIANESLIPLIKIKIISGLYAIHSNNFIHRDLKPDNILINNDGSVVIADFGLAKPIISSRQKMTPGWITLWYRPLEMLEGQKGYTKAVDVWSIGCIFGEMVRLRPLFQGSDEAECVIRIIQTFGLPTEYDDYNVNFSKYQPTQEFNYERNFPFLPEDGVDLLKGMLNINPSQRFSAKKCMEHKFFDEIRFLSLDEVNSKTKEQSNLYKERYVEVMREYEERQRIKMQEMYQAQQAQQRVIMAQQQLQQQLQQQQQQQNQDQLNDSTNDSNECQSLEASPEYDL